MESTTPGMIERQMLLSRFRHASATRKQSTETTEGYRFITVSRDLGALGNFVASGLAARLHWQVFDKEIVDYIAENSRVRQELVQDLDEKTLSLVHDTVARLLRMAEGVSFGNEEYHKALLKTLATLAAHGGAVIVGRGGACALHGEPGLHMRVTGSLEVRVERIGKRMHLSREEARRLVLQTDAERRSFLQQHFRAKAEDARFYDCIFNTDRVSVEQVVGAVLAIIKAGESGAGGTQLSRSAT